jgi:hypothetical protein
MASFCTFTKNSIIMKFLPLSLLLLSSITAFSQNYQSAESVQYDIANDRWLVANGSNIIIDDGNGDLSFFGSGSASHGMEIMGNTLFVIAGGTIKGYDLTTENEVMSLLIPGTSFLNGMTSDGNTLLWVTDFGASKIYAIDVSDLNTPVAIEIVANTGSTPNGILYDNVDRLLFVTWGSNAKIKAVSLSTNAVSDIADTGLGNIDGIQKSEGEYFISSWSPNRITRYSGDFSDSFIVDTPTLSSPADIGVSQNGILGIPMGNEVIFVNLNGTASIEDLANTLLDFNVSENPITLNSYMEFRLVDNANVSIDLYSILGTKIKTIVSLKNLGGFQKINLSSSGLTSGIYILKIIVDGQSLSKKLIVK